MTTPVNGIYVLQGVVPAEIAAAPVEIKVVEIFNDNGQMFSASQVAQMAAGSAQLMGYFSIGEAENYRDYFASLPKSAIGPVDPDWPGNYQVAYWTDAWKAVCIDYIDRMLSLGYEGAYFDVVCEYDTSWAKNNAPGGDSAGEMVKLIKYLADYAHAKNPDFKIWANTSGAEDLLTNPTFVNAIDGAFEEELFYKTNGSPQRQADVNYNLNLLNKLLVAGKPVVAIEYVSGAAVVADVHAKAAAAGVGSYVADLELNGIDTEGFTTTSGGGGGTPTISGTSGNDLLTGTTGNDTMDGGAGNDTLNGGAGADSMAGGIGNDTYYIDNAGDIVVEAAGAGKDSVYASVSYTLMPGVEVEYVKANAGKTGLALTGNEFANRLVGAAGSDTLSGGGGDDILNGAGGADVMDGGAGNDKYYVDKPGDVVNEAAGNGSDTICATVNYTVGANSEIEFIRADAGSKALALTGNGFANTLVGNSGNDTLNGGGGDDVLNGGTGADVMAGGAGDDKFQVDNALDVVQEAVGNGVDTVYTTVSYALTAGAEVEYLRGSAGNTALSLTGNGFANFIVGNTGNDTLIGGAGADTLAGGGGADLFGFGSVSDSTSAAADQIIDFSVAQGDLIDLHLIDANAGVADDQAFSFIGTQGLSGKAGELSYAVAGGTTRISGDVNGDGIADLTIDLKGIYTLTQANFIP
ncbi:MAG: endo alpha-1,4 polygalactosaminidase [Acetobacteraceae bacterium]